MPNFIHVMIPADDVARARAFYSELLGWTVDPVRPVPDPGGMAKMEYHSIMTGNPRPGTLNSAGLYRRHQDEKILDFVEVDDIDATLSNVEKLGGKITMPKTAIPGVGHTAMILDSEGNIIGLLKPGGA